MINSQLAVRFASLPGNLKGAVYLSVAAIGFTVMVTLIKLAGERLHVSQILLIRQVVMTAIVAPGILAHFPGSLKTTQPYVHLLRVVFALLAMLCGFYAIIEMPLADATAIGFAKSFFVTILAIFVLNETVGVRRWVAVAIGFVGVLIMVKPGTSAFDPISIYALVGSAAAGLVMVLLRKLSRTDSATTILTYQAVFVGVAMIGPGLWFWVQPTLFEWGLLVAIGLISYGAQMLNIYAYKFGEASFLASLDYIRLIYATILGYWIFSTLPDTATWIGAGIIVAASIYTVQRERVRKQALARSPEGSGYSH
ncbi:MAG: DMT family transporter [Pseudomonadota bacterium]